MNRRLLFAAMLILMFVLSACAPIRCPCEQIAVPLDQQGVDWECVSVKELEAELQEDIPSEAYEQCVAATPIPPAPAIWLADVCEPNNGFSADGNMTIATDSPTATLYVAPSMNGPWTAVAVSGPPWVVKQTDLETLGAQLGVASVNDVWLKSGEAGYPANLGSMIINREAKMDALCGS